MSTLFQALPVILGEHKVLFIFFPNGDIGRFSVCGMVNDKAMMWTKSFDVAGEVATLSN
ncbi:MAG: hypothetical protein ABH870_03225 [bacterium]